LRMLLVLLAMTRDETVVAHDMNLWR
jgi:hypothetical protein